MSRYLLVDGTTGAILTTIVAPSEEAALLYAGAGQMVMAITSDTGAHVDDASVKVNLETGAVVKVSGGAAAPGFESSTAEEIAAPE